MPASLFSFFPFAFFLLFNYFSFQFLWFIMYIIQDLRICIIQDAKTKKSSLNSPPPRHESRICFITSWTTGLDLGIDTK